MVGITVKRASGPDRLVWLVLCPVLLLLLARTAVAASVTASVNRPVINFGETVTLSLSIEGAQTQQPTLPEIRFFQVVGSGSSLQIINGAVQQSFTYELSPTQPGDLVIPAMQFNLGGQASVTKQIVVKVLPPGQNAGGGPPPAFIKLVLSRTNLFVGEVADLDVQVYFQEGRLTQYPQIPTDPGFTIGKWAKPTETRVAVNNVAYSMVSFKAPVIAVKTGSLALGPVTEPVVVPDRNRRPTFFFQSEREIRVTAERITATARPLPTANVPPTFAGAVGQYSVSMTATPTNVMAGDPITVRIQVAGRGWLDAVTLPPQPQWREFKMYAPTIKVEGADANNVSGGKTFEIPLVPQNGGIKALPSFAFSYFDPEAAAYRTAAAVAIPLSVAAATNTGGPLPRLTATNATTAVMSDIAHIKVRLDGPLAAIPLTRHPWFLLLQAIAPALWLGLVIRRRRAESLANNPRRRRRREVDVLTRKAVADLRAHAAANRSEPFFATLLRALQEQIGERLDVPANSITEAAVSEQLRPRGFPDAGSRELDELFNAANLARYAPVQTAHELNAIADRAAAAIQELKQWEPSR